MNLRFLALLKLHNVNDKIILESSIRIIKHDLSHVIIKGPKVYETRMKLIKFKIVVKEGSEVTQAEVM